MLSLLQVDAANVQVSPAGCERALCSDSPAGALLHGAGARGLSYQGLRAHLSGEMGECRGSGVWGPLQLAVQVQLGDASVHGVPCCMRLHTSRSAMHACTLRPVHCDSGGRLMRGRHAKWGHKDPFPMRMPCTLGP